jgi:ArsR family transcriptional regulator, virulence genes transcriptional regulator
MKSAQKSSGLEHMAKNAARAEAMLKLLANAKRLMILCHLVKGRKSVGELAELVGLSQSALSQHLAKMRDLSLVTATREGQMVYYTISNFEAEAMLTTLYLIYCKP